MLEFITNSPKKTENLGKNFAEKIIRRHLKLNSQKAIIISLEGDLGGGKTTFTKGFARGLGIKDNIKSPTFIIFRKFQIPHFKQKPGPKTFYHFDCYRIEDPKEILDLEFKKIIENPQNIVIFEWGDKIKKILPDDCFKIKFEFLDKNKRKITIS